MPTYEFIAVTASNQFSGSKYAARQTPPVDPLGPTLPFYGKDGGIYYDNTLLTPDPGIPGSTNLDAPGSVLTHDVGSDTVTVTPNGLATVVVTITDARGAGANGKVVNFSWDGLLYIDKNSITLDGSGQGSFTLGPCPSGQCTSAGVSLTMTYADAADAQAPVLLTVKFQ